MIQITENNQATASGEIISDFSFSHVIFGERFYKLALKVDRASGNSDIIPLVISERLTNTNKPYIGRHIKVRGQFQSYNKHEDGRSHLVLSLFVKELEFLDAIDGHDLNEVFLDGYICKEPVYRTTFLGREIADVMLAVNRAYNRTDYIPCICWGRNARYVGKLPVGVHVQFAGRIQSREYQKRLSEDTVVKRTAYEVSVSKICVLPIPDETGEQPEPEDSPEWKSRMLRNFLRSHKTIRG